MDETELEVHERTYHRFMLGVKWFAIHCAVIAVFFGMWLASPAGFGWALIAAVIVGAVGIWAMRHGLAHSSEGHPTDASQPRQAHG